MKTDNDRNWAKNWKDRLEGFSVTPPPEVWEELCEEIAPRKSIGRKVVLWAAAACIALLTGTAIRLHYLSTNPLPTEPTLEAKNIEATRDILPETEATNQSVKGVNNGIYYTQIHTTPIPVVPEEKTKTEVETKAEIAETTDGNQASTQDREEITENDPTKEKEYHLLPHQSEGSTPSSTHIRPKSNRKEKGGWTVGVSLGNNLIAAADQRDGFGNLAPYATLEMASIPSGESSSGGSDKNVTPYQHIMLKNMNSQPTTDIKHHFPISAGITVQKSLNQSLALETGIVYTYLASDLTAGDASYYTQKQELHYLGIPLKLNWNFLQRKYFNLYLTGGGMMEKCVSGKLSSHYETEREPALSESKSLHVNPLQWSLSAAAGISFKLATHIHLYAEPGIIYYFDDGADISTIRKEKPFNINLQAGLRFDF